MGGWASKAATRRPSAKLLSLPFHRMRVDTTDPEVDAMLRGYRRVVTGYREFAVVEVV